MVDTISKSKRSWNMSRISSRNTRPEVRVRKNLHKLGYRFRIHRKDLPGKPDIILPKFDLAIQVHGCFWHSHEGCKSSGTPKSNVGFWESKLSGTKERDIKNKKMLEDIGWRVEIIWECDTKDPDKLTKLLESII